jgi:hypothetical protein
MRRHRWIALAGLAALVALLTTLRWEAPAQDATRKDAHVGAPTARPAGPTVQDALLTPIALPFAQPTSLARVAEYLHQQLAAPVVIDRAALARLELNEDDTVQLQLEGVRLKTGLQLLLDQLGLTYRVVPEDNLLVLTDKAGAEDVNQRILAEVETLHREVHDLQDAVDALTDHIASAVPAEPAMRNPTIIEELPPEPPGAGEPKGQPQPEPAPARRPRPG